MIKTAFFIFYRALDHIHYNFSTNLVLTHFVILFQLLPNYLTPFRLLTA